MAATGASEREVGVAAGLSQSTVSDLLIHDIGTDPSTERRLRAVTVDTLMTQVRVVSFGPTKHLVNCLRAQGFPVAWVARQTNHSGLTRAMVRRNKQTITARQAADIQRLADRIGDREANDDDGIPYFSRQQAKAIAARYNYYPRWFYDDDGNLDLRAIPGHPWQEADKVAEQNIDVVRALLRRQRHASFGPALGMDSTQIGRIRQRAGIEYEPMTLTDQNDPDVLYTFAPTTLPRLPRLRAAIDAYDYHYADPVLTVLRLDCLSPRARRRLPDDHPGVLAWQQEIAQVAADAWDHHDTQAVAA